MKKIAKKIMFSCSVVFALPIILMVASYPASFLAYYVFPVNTQACSQSYVGVSKGAIWDRGEWHHYVDFKVNNSASSKRWEVTNGPLPSSIWDKFSTSSIKRVSYRWPSNWVDPFPASDWKICAVNS